MQEPTDKSDRIIAFLTANGAPSFAKILYNVPLLFEALKNPNLSMIFAPDEEALSRLVQATRKSLGELQRDAYGVDILANHISIIPSRKIYPMFTSINGQRYGSNVNDIQVMNVSATIVIDSTPIIVINSVIVHPGQVEKASLTRDAGVLQTLGQADSLWVLIQKGDLKGKDLISLCVSNPEVNKLCNAKLDFNYLLKRDLGTTAPQGINPRDYYVKQFFGFKPWTTVTSTPQFSHTRTPSGPIKPINTNKGFVQIAAGDSFTALLDGDGNVFLVGTIWTPLVDNNLDDGGLMALFQPMTKPEILKSFGDVPVKLNGVSNIVKIRAGKDQVVMVDRDGQVWLYGSFDDIILLERHTNIDEQVMGHLGGQAMSMNVAYSRISYGNAGETFPVPARLEGLSARAWDISCATIHAGYSKPVVVVLDNPKYATYGRPGYVSREIKQLLRGPIAFITEDSNGVFELQTGRDNNSVNISNMFRDAGITARDIVKVEQGRSDLVFLDNRGRLWKAPAIHLAKMIAYDPDPSIEFIDIAHDGHYVAWALAKDGRLFAALDPRQMYLALSNQISDVVAMSFYPGEGSSAGLLTRW